MKPDVVKGDLLAQDVDVIVNAWNRNVIPWWLLIPQGVSGAIKKKGGAGFAVGIAIQDVVEAIALDKRQVLPISSVQDGCYGVRDVALSVPTVIGRTGVVATHEIELWPKEIQGIRKSGQVLRDTIDTVLKRLAAAA